MSFRLFGVIKKVGTWTSAGFVDRMYQRFTGKKHSLAKHVAAKLDKCEPWTDHFEKSSLESITTSIKDKNFVGARIMLSLGVKETASRYCVDLAFLAVELLACGDEITYELFECLE